MCVLCCCKQSAVVAPCECLLKQSVGEVCVKPAIHCEDTELVLNEQTRLILCHTRPGGCLLRPCCTLTYTQTLNCVNSAYTPKINVQQLSINIAMAKQHHSGVCFQLSRAQHWQGVEAPELQYATATESDDDDDVRES
jgi:hypothetical protein